jgi:hypothetical protein
VTLRAAGVIPVVDSDEPVSIVAAAMDYGLWTKTPDGEWHNKGRDEVPTATLAEHNWKYAVHLTQMPTKPVPLIEGHTLQLVPATTTIPQKMGEPFTVRAMYKGKPMAGVIIMSDYVNDPDEAGVKTSADGTATIKLRNQGLNVIMAIYVGPADDSKRPITANIAHRSPLSCPTRRNDRHFVWSLHHDEEITWPWRDGFGPDARFGQRAWQHEAAVWRVGSDDR